MGSWWCWEGRVLVCYPAPVAGFVFCCGRVTACCYYQYYQNDAIDRSSIPPVSQILNGCDGYEKADNEQRHEYIVDVADNSHNALRNYVEWHQNVEQHDEKHPKKSHAPKEEQNELRTPHEHHNSAQHVGKFAQATQEGASIIESLIVLFQFLLCFVRFRSALEKLEHNCDLLAAERTLYSVVNMLIKGEYAVQAKGMSAGRRNRQIFWLSQTN